MCAEKQQMGYHRWKIGEILPKIAVLSCRGPQTKCPAVLNDAVRCMQTYAECVWWLLLSRYKLAAQQLRHWWTKIDQLVVALACPQLRYVEIKGPMSAPSIWVCISVQYELQIPLCHADCINSICIYWKSPAIYICLSIYHNLLTILKWTKCKPN